MSDPTPAPRLFDRARVLRALRALERGQPAPWLHEEAGRRMAERLSWIRLQPAVWVDWWAHAGAAGALVAAHYPQAERWVVEPTEALRHAANAAAAPSRWSWLRRAGPPLRVAGPHELPPGQAQLVWANMMLHAAMDPSALIALWHKVLAVDGFVMFSCLGPGSLRELAQLYQRMGWPEPMADLVDMHDLGDMLVRAGFADPVMDQETLVLSWADPESALQELRGLGGNASPERFPGLRTPRWRASLLRELEALRGADGRITLHVELVYGHAFKAPPRPRVASEISISVADMRAMVGKRDARD